MNKVTAIVLAAGQGKRMNASVAKQFLILKDKPVLYYSLKAFEESNVDEIILVAGAGQVEYCQKEFVDHYRITKVTKVIEGGKERYDSVYNALQAAEPTGYVLIHDGARPFLSPELIETVIREVIEYKACIVGTPVKETIKIIGENGIIASTPNRNTLWTAQTPQAFEYSLIRQAYDQFYVDEAKSELGITDDAMVYENYQNCPVKMITGDYNNIKLTTPEDLLQADGILNAILCEKDKKKKQF